jgi:hypothetical protein
LILPELITLIEQINKTAALVSAGPFDVHIAVSVAEAHPEWQHMEPDVSCGRWSTT